MNDSVTSHSNDTSSADFDLGFSLGDDIPDGESTRLSEDMKHCVLLADVTYNVEVSIMGGAEMPTAPILSEVFRFLHAPSDITIT